MTTKKISNFIAAPGAFLLLVFYFLLGFAPDIRLSNTATETFLQENDPKLYLIPLIAIVVLLLALFSLIQEKALTSRTSLLGYVLPSVIGIGLMIAHYLNLASDKASLQERASGDWLISIAYQPGWWLSFAALIGIFMAGALVFLTDRPQVKKQEMPLRPAPPVAVTPPPPRARALTVEEMKARMIEARELIVAKRYQEARTILRTVNHPTAEKWLQKLDEIAPE